MAGEFEREGSYQYGRGQGGPAVVPEAAVGQQVDTSYRDHVRSLQLLRQAVEKKSSPAEELLAWREIASVFKQQAPWKWQTLTPLETLPEWGEPGPDGGTEGAPWKGDAPVLFSVPASWQTAANDGERWRLALEEQVRLSTEKEDMAATMIYERAGFSRSQFGVGTLAANGWWRQQEPENAKGILEVDTLAEDECLAKTSDGVRRFKLPAEHHFIALYRSIFDNQPPRRQRGRRADGHLSEPPPV